MKQDTQITRRGFMQLGSGALVVGGILNSTSESGSVVSTVKNFDSGSSPGRVALEEHFDFAGTERSSYASFGGSEFQGQIKDLGSGRIAEMDRGTLKFASSRSSDLESKRFQIPIKRSKSRGVRMTTW